MSSGELGASKEEESSEMKGETRDVEKLGEEVCKRKGQSAVISARERCPGGSTKHCHWL